MDWPPRHSACRRNTLAAVRRACSPHHEYSHRLLWRLRAQDMCRREHLFSRGPLHSVCAVSFGDAASRRARRRNARERHSGQNRCRVDDDAVHTYRTLGFSCCRPPRRKARFRQGAWTDGDVRASSSQRRRDRPPGHRRSEAGRDTRYRPWDEIRPR